MPGGEEVRARVRGDVEARRRASRSSRAMPADRFLEHRERALRAGSPRAAPRAAGRAAGSRARAGSSGRSRTRSPRCRRGDRRLGSPCCAPVLRLSSKPGSMAPACGRGARVDDELQADRGARQRLVAERVDEPLLRRRRRAGSRDRGDVDVAAARARRRRARTSRRRRPRAAPRRGCSCIRRVSSARYASSSRVPTLSRLSPAGVCSGPRGRRNPPGAGVMSGGPWKPPRPSPCPASGRPRRSRSRARPTRTGALHELFGFAAFRPGQADAVGAALADRDVLVVMPTGSGKSLCYQLPALMRTDLTLVVSPLVSLMQDQVEALERVAPGRVGLVNAQRDAATNRKVIEQAAAGHVRLLYVAPERFSSPGFLERLRGADIGLFVVDEAHCVSQWGHDFRPDYFRLADAARWLGAKAIVASTATATPQVAADIVTRLGLRDPVRVATGFDRPNLSFAVVPCATKEAGHRGIATALAEQGALPAIVYAGTRNECDKLSTRLARELGVEVERLPRGPARDGARRGAAALHGRRVAGGGRHQRVRHGRRQGRRADGLPRERPGLGRGLLPGGRPRRARRQARALPAVRLHARQGPARVLHRALDGRRGRDRHGRQAAARPRGRRALRGRAAGAARGRRRRGGRRGARDRRPPRARRRDPAGAVAARPRDRPRHRRVGRAALARLPHVGARGHEGALAPVPLGVGVGRGPTCRRLGSCATSATRASRRPRARAATSAIPRCCPRRRPRAARRAADRAGASSPSARGGRRSRSSTTRSSTWSRPPSPASGARGPSRSCAAGARR